MSFFMGTDSISLAFRPSQETRRDDKLPRPALSAPVTPQRSQKIEPEGRAIHVTGAAILGVILPRQRESGEAAIVGCARKKTPSRAYWKRTGWSPACCWWTHHHADHVAG